MYLVCRPICRLSLVKDKSLSGSLSTFLHLAAGGSAPLAAGPPALLQVHCRRLLVLVPLSQDGRQHQVEQCLKQRVHIVARLGTRLEAHLLCGQAALLVQALVAQDSPIKGCCILGGDLFVQHNPREGRGGGWGCGARRQHLWLSPLLTLRPVLRRHIRIPGQLGFRVCEIGLVAHDGVNAVVVSGISQGQEALLQLSQALPVGDIVSEDDRGCTPTVHGAQPVELFTA